MYKVFYFALALTLFSCGDDKKITNNNELPSDDAVEQEFTYSAKQLKELKTAAQLVHTLPPPLAMAEILLETNAIYDVDILNDPDDINDYITDMNRSYNLGVFFADLSFTSMFNQQQEVMKFMGATRALSDELNIVGIFTEELMMRLEENMNNKDSLMDIVGNAYMETDLYLQDNDRPIVAKTILSGAWIEGLYIAVNLNMDNGKEQPVWDKIAEQKPSLANLVKMMERTGDPSFAPKIKELKELQLLFEEVNLNYDGPTTTEVDTVNKVTKLGGSLDIVISKETFEKIKAKTIEIRNGITNL